MSIKYGDGQRAVRAQNKLLIAASVGVLAGVTMAALGKWQVALLAAWDVAALTYVVWTWHTVLPMSADTTSKHAVREDPSRAVADTVVLVASVGSLLAVATMLAEAGSRTGVDQIMGISFSIFSVVMSWVTVHTIFMLRYAEIYYSEPVGGIDFLETKQPSYHDFAYLALTMGMTFQVSDTSLQTTRVRRIALKHALLSYVFGTVIVASTINLIVSLGH